MSTSPEYDKIANKVRKYCAYQERSQQEVRDKLYDEGLHKKEVEQCISELVSEGFINEERFAIAYAGGKFRIKQWGKVKIKMGLKAKKVSDYCIRKALSTINDKDYRKVIEKVVASYGKKVKEKEEHQRLHKIARHAIGRGFEPEVVWEILKADPFE